MNKLFFLLTVLLLPAAAFTKDQDCFVKKSTWRESMFASREALLKQETAWDNAEFAKTGIKLGDWYYLPVGRDYKGLPKEISEGRKLIDVTQPMKVGKKTYNWVKLPALQPGVLHDTSKLPDLKKLNYAYLYTTVTVPRNFPRGTGASIGFSIPRGQMASAGSRSRAPKGADKHVEINHSKVGLRMKKGTYALVVLLDISRKAPPYFWYQPQVEYRKGGMERKQREARRHALFDRVKKEFNDPLTALEINLERGAEIWPTKADWVPGDDSMIKDQYKRADRLKQLKSACAEMDPTVQAAIKPLIAQLDALKGDSMEVESRKFIMASILMKTDRVAKSFKSVNLAIENQIRLFGSKYPNGKKNLAAVAALEGEFKKWLSSDPAVDPKAIVRFAALQIKIQEGQKRVLLDNPLLKFEKLLVASGGIRLATNWGGACSMGNELQVLSPVSPDGKLTTIHKGGISSYELDWAAKKILFSDGKSIMEMDADGSNLRTIKSPTKTDGSKCYDPCRMPGGDIMFVSTACQQAVPCTGGSGVGNMHIMSADGKNERRITYDQDHNWDPCILNSGRVIYTRWEYTDLPHYFTRILMSMNPDGTDQKEYYGSSSYWPNAMYWARPIPGEPSKIVTIVSGHHGTSRMGELLILEPAKGRHEADGVVQRIPGYGKKVEPIIMDGLVNKVWPKFITPYPLGTSPKDGAGTYFLTSVKRQKDAPWQLCLVDIFDNITPILEGAYAMPIPVLPRKKPPVVPSRIDPAKKNGTAMIIDIYTGPGLKGFPKGSIKSLRIGTYHFRYPGNGDTYAASMEGGWDIRRIIGTVPVYEDGSAFFEIPANTPIFVQPLDADGQALQVMRSWFTAQPGENLNCIGCHESQNLAPPSRAMAAARKAPSKIKPWNGPMRGFSFDREVQPVLDRKCVGCHDGKKTDRPDFRAKRLHKGYKGKYSPAYMALQKYVRRAGFENDYHTPAPGEYQADTSQLIQMLKKGHPATSPVRLTRNEWDRLYTWIDFNIPYPANWSESHRAPKDAKIVTLREKMLRLYSAIDDRIETTQLPLPPIAPFQAPPKEKRAPGNLKVDGWPIPSRENAAAERIELDLGDGVKMPLVKINAGAFIMGDKNGFADERPQVAEVAKPFYMGVYEVSLAQYRQFDKAHENGFLTNRHKDQTRRGVFCMDKSDLPVVRISQEQAMRFCRWLAAKTGKKVTLPSEEQWEWACRAGSDKRFSFGSELDGDAINIADVKIARWNYGRCEPNFADRSKYTDKVTGGKPNAWGLHYMHGNVAEWTTTDYVPLRDIGGAAGTERIPYKVVKGGSWNDTARFATSASRWRYPKYQPVYNVGFRVIVEE